MKSYGLNVPIALNYITYKTLLYSGSWDKTFKVWRISDSKCLESVRAHDDAVNSIVAGCNGLVFRGSADGSVKDTASAAEIQEETYHVKHESQGDIPFSGPFQVSSSSGFAWAKRRKDDASSRSLSRSISRGHIYESFDPSAQLHTNDNIDSDHHENGIVTYGDRTDSRGHDSYEAAMRAMQKQWSQFEHPDPFDASDEYHSQELSLALYRRDGMLANRVKGKRK
ncbi:hypothetical protein F3Y22_tig00111151pilonHSYRG00336 [Hibiscus syriacus]|uniref:Uncharacterized protein n=1 Tax=Hibiscus syriacus TaxID=106335 RepID=A0A6A2YXF3_HIBSY|nr:hypothetical protein F3Y22_tig00111151pilonHSYRG00336 [Hibiscus syriacus]